ncbi:unnamed protein product, partial [Ixodes hexagonus]
CEVQSGSTYVGDRASCTFTRHVDKDPNRIPSEIPTVRCRCPDNRCSPLGDFRCHEVRETIKVVYKRGRLYRSREDTVQVTVACVCAVNRSVQAKGGNLRIADVGKPGHKYEFLV